MAAASSIILHPTFAAPRPSPLTERSEAIINPGLRPKASYEVLDFAESKGAAVCREPVWTWTGRAKAQHRRRWVA